MERYKKRFMKEVEKPGWFDKGVTNILKVLRDENFGSEDQRKSFIDMLTTLHNSKDKRARKVFKMLGDYLTDIGDELIKYGQTIEESINLPKKNSIVRLGNKRKSSIWNNKMRKGTRMIVLDYDKLDGESVLSLAFLDDYKKSDFDPEMDYQIVYPDEVIK